jgi:hypothetical protein
LKTVNQSTATKICGLSTHVNGSIVGAGTFTVTALALRLAAGPFLFQIEDHCLVGDFFQDGILNAEQPGFSPFDKGP